MNKSDWRQLQMKLKRPSIILALTSAAGFICCLILFLYGLLPAWQDTLAAEKQLEEAEERLADLVRSARTETIDPEQVKNLFLQVPPRLESDDLLRDLLSVQLETGAVIVSLNILESAREVSTDLLEQYLKLQQGNPAYPSNADDRAEGKANQAPAAVFTAVKADIRLTGTFPQIKSFINRLFTHERLFRVEAWSINPGTEGPLDASLTVIYYAAPEFAQLFQEFVQGEESRSSGIRE
jgi:hypothetical protein